MVLGLQLLVSSLSCSCSMLTKTIYLLQCSLDDMVGGSMKLVAVLSGICWVLRYVRVIMYSEKGTRQGQVGYDLGIIDKCRIWMVEKWIYRVV